MFADTSSSLPVWLSGVAVVVAMAGGILTLFITRREVESRQADSDRRLASHEGVHKDIFSKLGGVERGAAEKIEKARTEFREQLGDLHEKVNRVDKSVTAIEVETRLQSRTLETISERLETLANQRGA